MARIKKSSLLILVLFWSWTVMANCPHGSDRFNCVKFIRALDGDTIVVDLPGIHSYFGSKAQIRLYDIDAPELGKKAQSACEAEHAKTSRNVLQKKLSLSKRIDLKLIANRKGKMRKEKYGRILAIVYADGKNLNQWMRDLALAVNYDGKAKMKIDWCQKAKEFKTKGVSL
jgi:micrococcal nuclease